MKMAVLSYKIKKKKKRSQYALHNFDEDFIKQFKTKSNKFTDWLFKKMQGVAINHRYI